MDKLVYDVNMISGKIKNAIVAAIATIAPFALSLPAYAADCNTQHGTTFNWGCQGDGKGTIVSVFVTIFNWVSAAVVIAIIGGVVYGAILYSSSGGNKGRAEQGISVIRNAVVALILYVGMFAIINFLVPGGLFN